MIGMIAGICLLLSMFLQRQQAVILNAEKLLVYFTINKSIAFIFDNLVKSNSHSHREKPSDEVN